MITKVALGADHGGYKLKEEVKAYLNEIGVEFIDCGSDNENSCDYSDYAKAACELVQEEKVEAALLFCGTGVGISMAANKMRGIRACCCSDAFSAKYTRLHNDANALCLGGRVVGGGLAIQLVDIFLKSEFEGGRHQLRINKVMDLES